MSKQSDDVRLDNLSFNSDSSIGKILKPAKIKLFNILLLL